jgi:hypothetical protein
MQMCEEKLRKMIQDHRTEYSAFDFATTELDFRRNKGDSLDKWTVFDLMMRDSYIRPTEHKG